MSEETTETATRSPEIQKLIETIGELKVTQLVELKEAFKEEFKVEAAAPVMAMAGPAAGGGDGDAAEEKTDFDVILKEAGAKKIAVIKVVRAITGLGLKEAKELVDNTPKPLKEGCPKDEAEDLKKQLEEAGASVELK